MKTQIKKWGDSNVLVLSPDFMKFHEAKEGDWADLDDVVILHKEAEDNLVDCIARQNNSQRIKELKRRMKLQ